MCLCSVSEETLQAALGDPSESLIDAYVAVAQSPGISLDALMALLCACPLLVRVPVDTRVVYMAL